MSETRATHQRGQPRLVGRARELGDVATTLAAGGPGTVLIAPAGVGKSRLAREAFATATARDGTLGVWVQATRSAAAVPLGACAGLIPDDLRSDEPLQLMRGVAAALAERAEGRPVLVGVDDAQLLDAPSAALVLHLVVTGSATVLATVRSGEVLPDAVAALWKDAGAERVVLEELDDNAVGELVEALLDGPADERARRWAIDTSRGNALYVRELVAGAVDGGTLVEVDGLWRLQGRPGVSTSLAELVSARMEGLDAQERAVVELLAVGEPLRVQEITDIAGEEALVAVEARGVIRVDGQADEIRLAHPLYGETLAGVMPALRGRAVRRQLAGLLEARGEPTSEDALRIASWRLDAGDDVPPGLLTVAARAALRSGDSDLGARLAERARAAGAGIDAGLVLARAHGLRNRAAEADELLTALGTEVRAAGDQVRALRVLEQHVNVLQWGLKAPAAARELMAEAAEWWPDVAWRRTLDPLRLHTATLSSDTQETARIYDEMLADPDLAPDVRAQIENLQVIALYYAGRGREAWQMGRRRLPKVPLDGPLDELALVGYCLAGVEVGDDHEELIETLEATLDAAIRCNDHAAAGLSAQFLGGQALVAERYQRASRFFAESVSHFEHRDAFAILAVTRAAEVEIAHETGDPDEVERRIAIVRELLEGRPPLLNQEPFIVRAEATALQSAGDAPAAQRLLLEAAKRSELRPAAAITLRYWALRAGAPPKQVAREMRPGIELCDSLLFELHGRHIDAAAEADGPALLEVAEAYGRIGRSRFACEAAAGAAGVFAAEGREDSARRAAARSRELHFDGEGGVLPRIEGLDDAAIGLTKREEQLVELARRGLTNAEIAERLVLSVRTVESHLYRAMGKLGVSDRRDL